MTFEQHIVDIKRLAYAITGKSVEVHISYRGTDLGQTKPWIIKCDSKEVEHERHDEAARLLYVEFANDLRKRIESAETQASNYKSHYNTIVGALKPSPTDNLMKSILKDLS